MKIVSIIICSLSLSAFASISQEQFQNSIDKVVRVFKPVIESKGLTLTVQANWDIDEPQSQITSSDKFSTPERIFLESGGMARDQYTTQDGFEVTVCHEIGHILGGAPQFDMSGDFEYFKAISNEGEADYFASLVCLKKIWAADNNMEIVSSYVTPPPARVTNRCGAAFSDTEKMALCVRAAMAAKNFMDAIMDLYPEGGWRQGPWGPAADLTIFDDHVARETYQGHNHAQCRVDTVIAGALCPEPYVGESITLSMSDADPSGSPACLRSKGQESGARPLCWYYAGQYGVAE